ncbi:MAG TPA: ATP-dependent zinc metalloprotease FtsH [Thermodesulfobacteriota bacterium]|nr:ATP-dependent zinc metalloprotease FtsH [Thermodesulfobacteriota bacterium]
MASSQKEKQKTPKIVSRSTLLCCLILVALILGNVIVFWPKSNPKIEIPYSVFLSQVNTNNVVSVQIADDKINGSFTKPFKTQSATYNEFTTFFPLAMGDPNLFPLLQAHGVIVDVTPPSKHQFSDLLINILPLLFLIVFALWIGRKATQSQSGFFGFGRARARRYGSDNIQVVFNDVAGADEAKIELQEVVDFLRHPQKYHELGARIPRGILLVGPPGTGKTLLARAVAGEAGVSFFSISGSEFVEMFVGVGASRVRALFNQAKAAKPSIIFVDELDAVGRRRGAGSGNVNDEREQTLNQLLVEMDGFEGREEVIVMAATNRTDVLDSALLRPGRFDRHVTVGLPDRQGREDILRIHIRNLRLAPEINLPILSRTTIGFSGADLANVCNEAALIAARHNHSQVLMADFEEAIDKILLGGKRPKLANEYERRVVAYHEIGHALVAWLMPAADPVHKVTIIPHGRALGVTEQIPGDDRYNYSRTYLMARLAVLLGGRTAEEIIFGEITTGAENDLIEATRLARRMVTRWGMGKMGLMAFRTDEEQPFSAYDTGQGRDFSEATAAQVDREVQQLLDERHEAVRTLLMNARNQLDLLTQVLLKEETISQETLAQILGPRSQPTE